MSVDFSGRWAWAEIDTSAIAANISSIASRVAPAQVWVAVKANGYGHGSVEVSRAVLGAGATALCVAMVDEGVILRRAGITAPVLVLSEQPPESVATMVGYHLTPTVTTTLGVAAVAAAAGAAGRRVGVHVKVDTGMHRVGVRPDEAAALAAFVASHPDLDLEGVFTHFAVADTPGHPANAAQLAAFNGVLDSLSAQGIVPRTVHAANSAAALANPASRFSAVRIGIAAYGLLPGHGVAGECAFLTAALSLKARVSALRWVEAGEAVSYGLVSPLGERTLVATVPVGYADGVPRRLARCGGTVLVNGRRRPLAGTVTMDQTMIDCGTDSSVAVGDEVVLLGTQGDETITADEWADLTGTIGHEITCGISARVHRRYP